MAPGEHKAYRVVLIPVKAPKPYLRRQGHIHTVAPEGVFTESGYFVHIPYVCRLWAVEIWQEKVFDFLVEEGRIDPA